MDLVLEIRTKNYDDDLFLIKKAMSHMETLVGDYNGYALSEPSSKFGWTFFKMAFKPNLRNGIEEKFSDMIIKYQANDQAEKFAKFIADYFISKGCEVKIKISD
ncbi:MAG: hypothetical protein OEW78_02425 [Nitrosopumilus sp.]|uniref:hypothetical protein n=1 Tax=Nitrosopumilus sp. TaxID=2024843 RepID=UPI002469F93D|nr:hypothetical protein [Nitrosopumilus sp.]MDH5430723.1 hypothetical protein [Nitrosopumilus sp.]MDH5696992.1 hypothetical protein [Nitrosopumilus sp.]